ncbi:MAG: type II toxin-antitoxin system YafQ family toxin [Treponema sp.]|nr:type II toxin-antitoxin system YafQ family toxin [Treponema sp.]
MNKKYRIQQTSKFKKKLKLMVKRRLPIDELREVVTKLQNDIPLPEKYRDHELHGDKNGIRECHIQNDWLLEYKKNEKTLILILIDTGSHSDLFKT